MRIAVPREQQQGEARVALTPESVKKLVAAGVEVGIESGAGVHAGFTDADYQTAGASLMSRADTAPRRMRMSNMARSHFLSSML